MKLSCGVIIINENNEILMGHVTGNKHYDLPKGMIDENESPLVCAIRECKEETSIELNKEELYDLGEHKYNKEKNLHLFLVYKNKNEIDIKNLECHSFFEDFYTKKLKPEVDGFSWIEIDKIKEYTAKSMGVLLESIKENIIKKNKFKI